MQCHTVTNRVSLAKSAPMSAAPVRRPQHYRLFALIALARSGMALMGKRFGVAVLATIIAGQAYAAPGWTESAAPTAVETVRTQGILILGAFGNPGTACTNPDAIWVDATHSQYQTIVASATTALATGLKLKAYVHNCTAIGWHGGTYNELTGDGAIFLEK